MHPTEPNHNVRITSVETPLCYIHCHGLKVDTLSDTRVLLAEGRGHEKRLFPLTQAHEIKVYVTNARAHAVSESIMIKTPELFASLWERQNFGAFQLSESCVFDNTCERDLVSWFFHHTRIKNCNNIASFLLTKVLRDHFLRENTKKTRKLSIDENMNNIIIIILPLFQIHEYLMINIVENSLLRLCIIISFYYFSLCKHFIRILMNFWWYHSRWCIYWRNYI